MIEQDPALRIREAKSSDVEELRSVYHSAYRENRELGFPASAETVTPAELEDWLASCDLYAATLDGDVVGAIRVEKTDPGRAKISRFAVHDVHKGEGIGSALLEHVEARLRDRGVETAWLTTPPDHPTLPAFYEKRGYAETAPYPLENRDYDEVVMEKEL